MATLDLWYERLDVDEFGDRFGDDARTTDRKRFAETIRKARSKNSLRAMSKLTEFVDDELRFRRDPPTLVPIDELTPPDELETIPDRVAAIIASYRSTLATDARHAAV